jgi:REP element-mobilizing transposase RayT
MLDTNSHTEIWLHIVFVTKYRTPFLNSEIENHAFHFISEGFRSRECDVKIINGLADHVHILIRMTKNWSLADLIREVKGSSTYQINRELAPKPPFQWQRGYSAFSVQYNDMGGVVGYIRDQKKRSLKGGTEVPPREE